MIFIVNPISGKGRKKRIVSFLKSEGCNVVFTEYAGHAEVIAREADEKVVVAVGGDGTVNEVARGILGTDKILGIIPCGSGDGLALHLGISRRFRKAYRTIFRGKETSIDTCQINGRPFFSVCGVGFDATVSERFALSGKRGLMNYIKQGLKTWAGYTPEKYRINLDGIESEHEAALITVGNANQWGNGAKITPLADISDGMLDITIVNMFKWIQMPLLGLRLMSGTLDKSPKVHCYRGQHITISRQFEGPAHADGDWFTAGTNIDIRIHPKSLKVIIP